MKDCTHDKNHDKDNRSFIGIVFLLIGLVFLGRNFDFIPAHISYILFSWPMLMIAMGFIFLLVKKKSISGLFMIGIGGIFLWNRVYPFSPVEWNIAWPAIFIFVGLALVVGYLNSSNSSPKQSKKSISKPKQKKSKWDDVEFDIDKIEPIEED